MASPLNENFKLAVLVQSDTSKETFLRYELINKHPNENTERNSPHTLTNLPQSYFIHGNGDSGMGLKDNSAVHKACYKSLQASQTASYDAATFLSNDFPHFKHRKQHFKHRKQGKKSSGTNSNRPSLQTGHDTFIISRDTCSNSTYRSSQYHSFSFRLPRAVQDHTGPVSTVQDYPEFLMIRQPGLQRSGPMSLSKDLMSFDEFDVVEVCTGMCLFSEQDLNSCIDNGTIRPSRLAQLQVSLSEKDIMVRLSTTIANTVSLYLHGSESRRRSRFRINIDIPSAQYYKDALLSYSEGKCSAEDVIRWIVAIRERRQFLFDAFAQAIEFGLEKRCTSKAEVSITLSQGLRIADGAIYSTLRASSPFDDWLALIMSAVREDPNEFWLEFLNLLEEGEQHPTSWSQLSTLSYMYEVAKPVLRARASVSGGLSSYVDTNEKRRVAEDTASSESMSSSATSTDSESSDFFSSRRKKSSSSTTRVLLLAIDDVDEVRIYTKAYQSLCRLSTVSARSPGVSPLSISPVMTRIVTICPAPRIVVGTSGSDPKWTRPSLWRASLREEGLDRESLQIRNGAGSWDSHFDILKTVYDESLVTHLEDWVRK